MIRGVYKKHRKDFLKIAQNLVFNFVQFFGKVFFVWFDINSRTVRMVCSDQSPCQTGPVWQTQLNRNKKDREVPKIITWR